MTRSGWRDISYLAAGTPGQNDVPGSDLDIICRVQDPDPFEAAVRRLYGPRSGFEIERSLAPIPCTVARFTFGGEAIEL